MSFIEIQFEETAFLNITQTLASASPNPFPILDFLPEKQLVRTLKIGTNSKFGQPAGISPTPGTLLVGIPAKVNHVSIDELEVNPTSAGTDIDVTLWTVVALADSTISLSVVAIQAADAMHPLSSPVSFGEQTVPLPSDVPVTITGSAMLRDSGAKFVVARVAITKSGAGTLLSAPLVDHRAGSSWAIFISKGALTAATRDSLQQQMKANLPSDIQIEDPAVASWKKENGKWGISLSIGLLAIDKCPALIGDAVDVSVEVDARLDMTINLDKKTLDTKFHLSHDVSDWDTFRCILQNFFSGIFVSMVPDGLVQVFGVLFETLFVPFALPALIDILAGGAVAGQTIDGFKKQVTPDQGDDATYTHSMPLPSIPKTAIQDAVVDSSGVVVRGAAPLIMPGVHTVTVKPGAVSGAWYSDFSCNTYQWDTTYECDPVTVTDTFSILGQTINNPHVNIFSTSEARPASRWLCSKTENGPVGLAEVEAIGDPAQGTTGTLYIHSSGGLTAVPIKKVSTPPTPPSGLQLAAMKADCQKAGKKWNGPGGFDLHWLIDPPPYESIVETLREWLVQVSSLPAGSRLDLTTVGAGLAQRLSVAGARGATSLNMITSATQTLHAAIGGSQALEVVMGQRMLLARATADLGAPIQALTLAGNGQVAALTADRVAVFGRHGSLLSNHPSPGATGLARDAAGMVAWGSGGAFRIAAGRATVLIDQPVSAVSRGADGGLVLIAGEGQFAVRRMGIARLATVAENAGARNVTPGLTAMRIARPIAAPPVQRVMPGPDKVVVAMGTRLLFTSPWGEKKHILQ